MRTPFQKKELTGEPDLHVSRRTGPTRTYVPVYADHLPPCNATCPAGENIQEWLAYAQAGNLEAAWQTIVRDNPLPAVHGRVCYHTCENACNRKYTDTAVSIHAVERLVGDTALEKGWMPKFDAKESGKRVLIVGAGPAGLSAAYHLRRLGHSVEIREAGPMAGGMLHFGIPKYRLPREVLDAEISRIEKTGVKITLNHKVTDLAKEKAEGKFDAAFVAVGAHIGRRTDIPAKDAAPILDAVELLRGVELGEKPRIGKRVAIYGGGNTAMDAARTALRLGAEETIIIYRRNREKAPAHDSEIQDALEEGVKIHWLRTIAGVEGAAVKVEKMKLDEKGWPVGTGEFETLNADTLVMALGQDSESKLLSTCKGVEFKDDTVAVNDQMMTGCEGVFAGGDMVPYERAVTVAVGHGKKAARCIDAWLRGTRYESFAKNAPASPERLHSWYYTQAKPGEEPRLAGGERKGDFREVVSGLTAEEAVHEAKRCLSCGNCYECDGCLGACPEDAVIKLGPGKRYKFDYEKCVGCGACFEQCPCGAIDLVEDKADVTTKA
jgi:NADPH-dependent glutamate synthase beta subunit-like oxidoreductase